MYLWGAGLVPRFLFFFVFAVVLLLLPTIATAKTTIKNFIEFISSTDIDDNIFTNDEWHEPSPGGSSPFPFAPKKVTLAPGDTLVVRWRFGYKCKQSLRLTSDDDSDSIHFEVRGAPSTPGTFSWHVVFYPPTKGTTETIFIFPAGTESFDADGDVSFNTSVEFVDGVLTFGVIELRLKNTSASPWVDIEEMGIGLDAEEIERVP